MIWTMIILTNTGYNGTQTQTRAVVVDSIIGYVLANEAADGVGHIISAERVDGSIVPLCRKGSEDECIRIIGN